MTKIVTKSTYQVELSQRLLNILVDLLMMGPDTDPEINELFDALEEHATLGGTVKRFGDTEEDLWYIDGNNSTM